MSRQSESNGHAEQSVRGPSQMALYHAEELTVCRPIEEVQKGLVVTRGRNCWLIRDAVRTSSLVSDKLDGSHAQGKV